MVYKKFKLEDLFKSQTGDVDIKQKDLNGKGYMVVSSGQTNNGVIGKTDIESKIINGNTITVDMFGYSYYREDPYKIVTHARVFTLESLFDEMSAEIGLYFVSSFHFLPKIYNYSNMCSWNKIKDINISLPTLTNPDNTPVIDSEHKYHPEGYIPDWQYMQDYIKELEQDYIKELEQDYIKELEQYLIVTGLNDYELTDEDREVLSQKIAERETSYQDRNNKDTVRNGREVREFAVNSLFKLQKVNKMLSKQKLNSNYHYPVYSSDTTNNGIIGYTNDPEFICNSTNKTYITFGDHTRSFNIADKSFSVLDNVKVLIPCTDNIKVLLYLITLWKKQIPNLGYSRHWKVAKDCSLALPVQLSPDNSPVIDPTHQYHPEGYVPDWEYMEKYIRAIEKLVIKDVVKYKDGMIEKMKEVI